MSQQDRVHMNDDQWLAKLAAVAESDAASAQPTAGYDAQEAIQQFQQRQQQVHTPQITEPQMPIAQPAPAYVAPAPEVAPMNIAPPSPPVAVSPPPAVNMAAPQGQRSQMFNQMPDLDIINQFMQDQHVGDILINGLQSIYIDRLGKMVDSGIRFSSHEEVWDIAERIVKSVGQSISPERPMVDTRMPDGSRVNIIAPPMALDGVTISIRKFPLRQITMDSMVKNDQLTPELAIFLSECVRTRLNMIITGGTGSGKTTLLNALSAAIDPGERIVTIEDSAELQLQQPHVVRLETTSAAPGSPHQEVTIRDLVKNALRMRPDRIIIGESRGGEALDILQAMNTGHDGSMTTLHSNSPRDALARLETMVAISMPQLPMRLVRQQIGSSVHIIMSTARCKDGVRRITYVSEVSGMEGDVLIMQDLVIYTEGKGDRPGSYRWANTGPRNQLVTDAARVSGMMRGIR